MSIFTSSSPLFSWNMSSPFNFSPTGPGALSGTNPLTIYHPVSLPNVYPSSAPAYPTFMPNYLSPNLVLNTATYTVDVDTGVNDNLIVQKDVTKYFMYKTLDKWIYDDFPYVLKYLKVDGNKVRIVKDDAEKDSNKIKDDTESMLEAKSDFIGDKILTESATRSVLMRVMKELGIKWYDLPYRESLVKEIIEKYIKRKLKNLVAGKEA